MDLLCRESSAGEAQTMQRRCNDRCAGDRNAVGASLCRRRGLGRGDIPAPPLVRQNRSHPLQGGDAQKAEPETQGVGSESAEGQA